MKKKVKIGSIIIVVVLAVIGVFEFYSYNNNKVVEIEFGVYSGNKWKIPHVDTYKIYDEAIALFEKQYPHMKVKVTYRSGTLMDDYSEWLAQKIVKGEEPDVFIILEEDFNTYSAIGLFEDLRNFIKEDNTFNKDMFYKKAFDTGKYGDKQYGLPMGIAPTFMIVNQTLLDKENIEIDKENWTWDTFYNICRAVTKDSDSDGEIDQFGVYGYEWDDAFYTNGDVLFSDNGLKIAFQNENLSETIEFMKRMYVLNKGTVVKENYFDKGNVAFKTFSLPEYRAYTSDTYRLLRYKNFEWRSIPFPKGINGESVSKLDTIQLGMSSRSKHKDVAWEFMKFLTYNTSIQQKVWKDTYMLPANTEVVEAIYSSNLNKEEKNVLQPEFLNGIIEHAYIDPRFKKYQELKNILDQNIFLIIAKDKDVSSGIVAIKRSLRENIEQ
ncbi:MAG: extracellular solute-binding protein family 1 [Clostridia bacterium]|jgi:multiple sugar transport system substrate-binding protein|nr:extracellular solute-binding protein family 1 [Clostridia bacterium]